MGQLRAGEVPMRTCARKGASWAERGLLEACPGTQADISRSSNCRYCRLTPPNHPQLPVVLTIPATLLMAFALAPRAQALEKRRCLGSDALRLRLRSKNRNQKEGAAPYNRHHHMRQDHAGSMATCLILVYASLHLHHLLFASFPSQHHRRNNRSTSTSASATGTSTSTAISTRTSTTTATTSTATWLQDLRQGAASMVETYALNHAVRLNILDMARTSADGEV